MHTRDRRQLIRVPQRLEIEYSVEASSMAEIADLGEGGALIVTPNPLPVGTCLRYKFHLPGDPIQIEGEARVTRTDPMLSMAVEFKGLSQEDRERVRLIIAA